MLIDKRQRKPVASVKDAFHTFHSCTVIMMNTQEEKMTTAHPQKDGKLTFKPITELQTKHMLDLLQKGNLPFIPDKKGFCDTRAVRNALTGYEFTGLNQILAKAYLHEKGLDGQNILTFEQANKCGAGIEKDSKAFLLSFQDMDKRDENGKAKLVINHYFAASQVKRPEKLPTLEQKAPLTTKAVASPSSEPSQYLAAYLACVKTGAPFAPSAEIAAAFSQKFKKALEAAPSNMFKIGRDAQKIIKKAEQGISQSPERKAPSYSATPSFSR